MPIVEAVPTFLESLSDDDLKKEVKSESKNDSLSAIVKSLKCIAASVAGQEKILSIPVPPKKLSGQLFFPRIFFDKIPFKSD
jgi:hypothetical protein